jgi:hypothetical protein
MGRVKYGIALLTESIPGTFSRCLFDSGPGLCPDTTRSPRASPGTFSRTFFPV